MVGRRSVIYTIFTLFFVCSYSQSIKTVHGEYTYYVPENVSIEEAKQIALDRAIIQALADEFGTTVMQTSSSLVENRDGRSNVDFVSIGVNEVKGEWLQTIGEPEYNIFSEQNFLVVEVSVKGKAREVVSASIDFRAKVLRNGTEDKFESLEFRDGDDMYVSFVSPISGFLAIYLIDEERQAYCLLPYRNVAEGVYQVNANHRYLFFDARSAPDAERPYVDEYTLTSTRRAEKNFIYVIFSTQFFAKAADSQTSEGLPRNLSFADFQKWLLKCRKVDRSMAVVQFPITVGL